MHSLYKAGCFKCRETCFARYFIVFYKCHPLSQVATGCGLFSSPFTSSVSYKRSESLSP
jgi:hypothetical protein